MKKILTSILILIITILFTNNSIATVTLPSKIKIAILFEISTRTSVTIKADNGIEVGELVNGNFLLIQEYSGSVPITVNKNGQNVNVCLDGINIIEKSKLIFRPKTNNSVKLISVNDKPYRGDLHVSIDSAGSMLVVNELPVEEYIYGVVARELGGTTQAEALKTQAVIARTYALVNYNKRISQGYNLKPTTEDQAYSGYSWESDKVRLAVDATKNMVVTYNGKMISTPYCATMGPKTENVKYVWGTDYPYLQSVNNQYESLIVKDVTWSVESATSKIKENLLTRGVNIGDITSISIGEKSPNGRVTSLIIKGTNGSKIYTNEWTKNALKISLLSQWFDIVTNSDVNLSNGTDKKVIMIGATKVKSSNGTYNFSGTNNVYVKSANNIKSYSMIPTSYRFNGIGNGHSVGLSQVGAVGMAMSGYTYDQIITHYYTGTKVEIGIVQ